MTKSKNIIIFLGAPGSGKGTQAKKLSSYLHIPHISTGSLFREHVKLQTNLGKKIASLIEQGLLIDDDLVLKVIEKRIQEKDCFSGFISDGFPRTLYQAQKFSLLIKNNFINSKLKALSLEISDEIAIQRITSRYTCSKCSTSINSLLLKGALHCPSCKGSLSLRSDDNEETVKKRLVVYYKEAFPVKNFYEKQGCLLQLNSELSQEDLFCKIKFFFRDL